MTCAIWWIRRDLRLQDNPALQAACTHGAVIPLFILDSAILNARWQQRATRRQEFLFAGLRSLAAALQDRGAHLIVRSGASVVPAAALLPIVDTKYTRPPAGARSVYAVAP